MKNNLLQKMIFGATLLLAAGGCTQDDDLGGRSLPEGKYPLEIASVTLSAEVTDEPWGAKNAPQTRVTENNNGNSSAWEGGEIIPLLFNGQETTYMIADDKKTLELQGEQLYWKNTDPQTITAWYPAYTGESGTVSLADQSKKLAYVLKGSGTGNHQSAVTLSFDHALAKVRVVLQGDQAGKVQTIQLETYETCDNTQGKVSLVENSNKGWITMMPVPDAETPQYWEANVMPTKFDGVTDYKIERLQVNGTNTVELANGGIAPVVAKINTITLTAGEMTYDR